MVMENELSWGLLFTGIWLCERMVELLGASDLLGDLIAGIMLGPAMFDIIVESTALQLLGKLGVMLLVVDSGLAVDVDLVKQVFFRATLAAFLGVLVPVLLSIFIIMYAFGGEFTVALVVGASLAPTSMGFSAKLLNDMGKLRVSLTVKLLIYIYMI